MRMNMVETEMDETLDTRFLRAVEAYCEHWRLSGRAFGDDALGDPGLVSSLRRGRSLRISTLDPVLVFMGDTALDPVFRGEVKAFLSVTRIKRSVLGAGVMNNPSFVTQFFGGTSPTLRTVHKVREWMMAHASAAEWRRIKQLAPPMPVLLSAMTARRPFSVGEYDKGSGTDTAAAPASGRDGLKLMGGVVDTPAAAARLGYKPGTLATYRVRGGGPRFMRLGGSVRYAIDDLDAWIAGRRRRGAHRRAV